MNRTGISLIAASAALTVALAACGGSSGGGGTTLLKGAITGFGSIHVAGLICDTNGAFFSADGVSSSELELEAGQIVEIQAILDANGSTCMATKVVFQSQLAGNIDSFTGLNPLSLTPDVGTLSVAGQTIHVNDTQVLASITNLLGLGAGVSVKVSGYSNGQGEFYATHLNVLDPTVDTLSEYVVTGFAANAVTTTGFESFDIGGLTISYSGLPVVNNGDEVRVTLNIASYDSVALTATATGITELESDSVSHDGEEMELEGMVSGTVTTSTFIMESTFGPTPVTRTSFTMITVSGTPVTVDITDAKFEDGAENGLLDGMMVQVEGAYNGTLFIADELEVQEADDAETSGLIASVSIGVDVLTGSITLVDNTVIVTDHSTRFDDERDEGSFAPEHVFDLQVLQDALTAGEQQYIKVEGATQPDGSILASKLERDDIQP